MNTKVNQKMTDAELSKKLGHYQKAARFWLLIGLIGVVSGTISFFAVKDTLLKLVFVTVLFFGGVCCAIFPGGGAQKKLKALLQEQMGDFFKAEFEKAFGPDWQTPEMKIDEPFMKRFGLFENQWEECEVENFHEGIHRSAHQGIHFSAANLRLNHVYERSIPHEGWETCREELFRGLVLRLDTGISYPSPVCVHARIEESPRGVRTGILTGDDRFNKDFCVAAEEKEAQCLLTPEFISWLRKTEEIIEGKVKGFVWEGNTFSVAIETEYGFAGIAGNVDVSNLDAVRKSYINSLRSMGETIDLFADSPVLPNAGSAGGKE